MSQETNDFILKRLNIRLRVSVYMCKRARRLKKATAYSLPNDRWLNTKFRYSLLFSVGVFFGKKIITPNDCSTTRRQEFQNCSTTQRQFLRQKGKNIYHDNLLLRYYSNVTKLILLSSYCLFLSFLKSNDFSVTYHGKIQTHADTVRNSEDFCEYSLQSFNFSDKEIYKNLHKLRLPWR